MEIFSDDHVPCVVTQIFYKLASSATGVTAYPNVIAVPVETGESA